MCITLNIHKIYEILKNNVLCAMLFFILLSIMSVKHRNMIIFWKTNCFSAYYRLILQNLAESFSR